VTHIDIVDTDALHARLGYATPFAHSTESRAKPMLDWKMETDDAPILAYIYANSRPKKHFEFGTWEGFGARLCAQSCDAEIWTANLPDGEVLNGQPAYESAVQDTVALEGAVAHQRGQTQMVQTDSGPFIGRLYREAGYESRVHQVLADTAQMPLDSYARGFFDSVLIDGGHTAPVVAADTERALTWLAPGGLCLWHDFCPDPNVLRQHSAPLGVAQAVAANWGAWSAQLKDAFWLRKSCLLIGVRA
jgi:predicted O-methyltransferase YrrM